MGHSDLAPALHEAPPARRITWSDGLVLESNVGTMRIEGEILLSLFDHHHFEMAETSILHQGTARYVWGREETIGLIERCLLFV